MQSLQRREPITQNELRRALRLQRAFKLTMANLGERLARGEYVETGELDFEGEEILPRPIRRERDRFRLLARTINTAEIVFTVPHADVNLNLRQGRTRVFRAELRELVSETVRSYGIRRSRLIAARAWHSYPALAYSTSRTLFSIGKL